MLNSQLFTLTALTLLTSLTSALPAPQFPNQPSAPSTPAFPTLPPPTGLPPAIPLPKTGYTLMGLSLDVKAQGDSFVETVKYDFGDDTNIRNHLTKTPAGSCNIQLVEGQAKPTSNYQCSPSQYVAVHNQLGSLRGDGSDGSTENFVINMFAGSFYSQWIIDFGAPIFNHPNISCTATVPPFSCQMNSTAGWAFEAAQS